ncbi:HNH endonuclease signature motif containing protein, partial [Ancrocorticia populi]
VGEPPDWASADPPDRTAAHQPIAGELDCPTEGLGLGRRGACLERRDDLERDLGAVLGMIRAGIDVGMLDGFAPAKLSDGSPLAPSQLGQLLCDSDLTRVVLTAHGEPIDVSRSQRLFSARQSKAVLARDQHCRFPGCSSGIEVGQVHHAQEWEKGGATVVDNAVLLCFHHHRYVHSKQITIAHHAGGFVFTERNGARIGITRHVEVLAA